MTLEERFAAAIDELELPEVDLVAGVLDELGQPHAAPRSWRPLAAAAALVVLACVATVAAVGPARDAVASWLGIGSTRIEVGPSGQLSGGSTASAADTSGTPVRVERNPIPALGEPLGAFDGDSVRGRRYLWASTPDLPPLGDTDVGAVLWVRDTTGPIAIKRLVDDTSVEHVTLAVDGVPTEALWIGAEHEFVVVDGAAPLVAERVLIWVIDDVQYRLEADLALEAVLDLAASVEDGTDLLPPG